MGGTDDNVHKHLDGHSAVPPRQVVVFDGLDRRFGDGLGQAVQDGRIPQQTARDVANDQQSVLVDACSKGDAPREESAEQESRRHDRGAA